ncbi:hypothetical protein THAOC_22835 [Thalassiosira oceanica]|uniref:Uncharacterized protein n=1 Tax=Thalassiosira oceanica TaxID=159749 RepID=K0RTI5_THAOC|nr:hypothetical protein THAOC_22835 [Thalassiosira oceanica]|eukprot:EJK57153.1 hypothetical protein THAOC_22835 [Thalassiosira oceanica]
MNAARAPRDGVPPPPESIRGNGVGDLELDREGPRGGQLGALGQHCKAVVPHLPRDVSGSRRQDGACGVRPRTALDEVVVLSQQELDLVCVVGKGGQRGLGVDGNAWRTNMPRGFPVGKAPQDSQLVDPSDTVGPDAAFNTLRSLTNDPGRTDDDVTVSQSPSSQTTALTTRPQSATGGPTSAPEKGPESDGDDRMDPTADSSEVRTSMGGSLADASGMKGCLSGGKWKRWKVRKENEKDASGSRLVVETFRGEVSRLPRQPRNHTSNAN